MKSRGQYRAFLKSDRWEEWRKLDTDQKKQIPSPALQKPAPDGAELVDLTEPVALAIGDMPLREAIRLRESHRRYGDEPLTLDELSFLVWATQGVRELAQHTGRTSVLRTVPSAGARHPFETYLVVNRVDGLEAGLYRYLSMEHRLCFLGANENLVERAHRACYDQYVRSSAVTFAWTVIPYRTEWRYDFVSPKLIAQDAGHVCQNLYLAATAIGAGACAIGAYDQGGMDEVLGVDGQDEFVIYVATVGKLA
jgi:SagB-type dehydrogenase family enzyme